VNPTEESLDEELKEFQLRLEGILKEFLDQGSIEVYGNLKIVVTSIDRPNRMVFLKGNTIYVNIEARRYPEFVLRIAHELVRHYQDGITSSFPVLTRSFRTSASETNREEGSGPRPTFPAEPSGRPSRPC
jgi:hypothetical protein